MNKRNINKISKMKVIKALGKKFKLKPFLNKYL